MALLKYSRPNLETEPKRFSDILDEFFNESMNYRNDSFMPSVDISETEDDFEFSVALPGLNKEDITVDIENGRLSISGERKFENEENEKNYHRLETGYGSFSRSFHLPDTVDENSIEAAYKDGILHITIAKNEQKVKKQIKIT